MQLIGSIGAGGNTMYQIRGLASNGEITLRPGPSGLNGEPFLPLPGGEAEVVLIVTPRAGDFQSFSAPGLTRGGRHDWTYEYHFVGVPIL
jgi:hypothetical protein